MAVGDNETMANRAGAPIVVAGAAVVPEDAEALVACHTHRTDVAARLHLARHDAQREIDHVHALLGGDDGAIRVAADGHAHQLRILVLSKLVVLIQFAQVYIYHHIVLVFQLVFVSTLFLFWEKF